MENKKEIKGDIVINAPKEKVWQVLLDDAYTRQWYAVFSEGSRADTDWKTGSKAIFTDHSGNGIFGRIIANTPFELLSIEYDGVIKKGKEDAESSDANSVKGGRETYKLSEENGTTRLITSCDMAPAFFEFMSPAWEKALQKIKELAETA